MYRSHWHLSDARSPCFENAAGPPSAGFSGTNLQRKRRGSVGGVLESERAADTHGARRCT
jgi:hypothetical protein